MEKYLEHMLSKGYFTSAKHQFQLLSLKKVNNKKLCFSIDLLHTAPSDKDAEMFVDHLDLDIFLSEEEQQRIKMKSIVQKESEILFDEEMFTLHTLGNGVTVKIVDFTGMFITKAESCQKVKRERDNYDIFLGFQKREIKIDKIKQLMEKNPSINSVITSFKNYLRNKENFNKYVRQYDNSITGNPAKDILDELS